MSNIDPSNPQSLLNDDQLSEADRAFISLFEEPVSDADGNLSAGEGQTPAPPGSTPDPAAPDASGIPVEGQAGASESDSGGEAPAEGEATGGETAQSQPAFTFAGTDYDATTLARAVQVHDWFTNLDNQQIAAIDALLSGNYQLAPAHPAAPVVPTPTQSAPAAQGQSPASTAPVTTPAVTQVEEAGDWLDPRAQAEVTRLNQQITELQQTISSIQPAVVQQVQTQQQQQLNQALAHIDQASTEFAQQYSLAPEQLEAIQRAVNDTQILPSLQARHNGDVKAAMKAGLEMMFWTTPAFRDPYVQQRTAADLANLTQQQQSDTVRQQQMTALSASGGSVPRRDPVPSNQEDRFKAMRDEIASAMNGQ